VEEIKSVDAVFEGDYKVSDKISEKQWEDARRIVYGEIEVVDSQKSLHGHNSQKEIRTYPSASIDERKEAYQVILSYNMDDVDPACQLYHYISMPHFIKAIEASAFFLARPYTWSKSDDPAFNDAIKTGKLDGVILSECQKKFLEAYMRNTFGMCWSRTPSNENLLSKKHKDGNGSPVLEIQSNAMNLLSAYLTDKDPMAPAKFFLVDMQYVKQSTLDETPFDPDDLDNVNYAFPRHREMLSLMAKQYKAQDEVRLIVERVDNEEIIVEDKYFAKRVDLSKVITGIKVYGYNKTVSEKEFIDLYAKKSNFKFEVVS
jgi:hypothetical protein